MSASMQEASLTILIIDDDPAMIDLLIFQLNDRESLMSATSGEAGLTLA